MRDELERLAADGELVAYFGYGSLVNRETLRTAYLATVPVRVRGWKRCWRPRDPEFRKQGISVSMLSARPDAETIIEGMVVFDRADHLPSVDEREFGYHRRTVAADRIEYLNDLAVDCPVYIYEAWTNHSEDDPGDPILQSYLDAVLQGFLREFGPEGVRGFVRTTDGFDRPVRRDRHQPIYARSVLLSDHERTMFDGLLEQHGIAYSDE
jgi:hypothetical protein